MSALPRIVTLTFAIFLVLHGLIHLLGAVKGFGWANLPQLTKSISPAMGACWLASALLFLGAVVAMYAWPRWWWAIGLAAVIASTIAVVPSWPDAKAGGLANVIVTAGLVLGFVLQGPASLRAQYEADVRTQVTPASVPLLTDTDVAGLPDPVRRYLSLANVIGRPRVSNFRVRMHGRIRADRQGAWMPFGAEQVNVVNPSARMFYLTATMFALPVQGYHRYVGPEASMLVKALGLVPVATAAGRDMTRAETVTLLNDFCVLAPPTLIDPRIVWEASDAQSASLRFTNAGHTVRARLLFDPAGRLIDFVSDDRLQMSSTGAGRSLRWSTPVRGYRAFSAGPLPAEGECRWEDPEGGFAYLDFVIDSVEYNVADRG